MKAQFEGELTTDGGTVYINGMDLTKILHAALPHRMCRDDPDGAFRGDFGDVVLSVCPKGDA